MINPDRLPNLAMWVAEPVPADVRQSLERLSQSDDVQHVAVMPDVHLAGDVCVGVAVATRNLLYPAAVGNDIGCGMAAIRFDASASLLADERAAARVLSGLYRRVPSLKHGNATAPRELPCELTGVTLSNSRLEKQKARDGRLQFGTLGRGNHFLELQADCEDRLWLMVHSGSRGIGQAIANFHQAAAQQSCGRQNLAALDANSATGQAYSHDAAWAVRYAALNRLAMVQAVADLFAADFGITAVANSLIHADHNHVRREQHGDQLLWVHRKGAQSASAGEPGIIPGSMGSASFHVSGRGHAAALCSSSHGAGRSLGRAEASRTIGRQRLLHEMRGVWFDQRQADRLRDEAPSAYKDIHAVMRAQRELTRIERELRPLLSYKGA